MSREKKILRLNMQAFDAVWHLKYAYTHLKDNWSPAPWKKELMYFIIDWLSDSETIDAQTSGSTGNPKKIKLYKKRMEASAQATLDVFDLKAGDKALLCLPIKYIAAKMMVVRAFKGKLDLYCIPPSLSPVSEWTPSLDFAAFTPAQLSQLLKTESGASFVNNIRKIILGGGPVPADLEENVQTLEPQIWHTYGMTETMSHIALRKMNGTDRSNCFYPLPDVQLTENESGCLTITAPYLGVYGLETNDLVEMQNDGGFKILGRKDHVVNSGGVKLFPEQIEQKLSGFIEEPFYVGAVPDEQLGEKLTLFVESENPDRVKKEQLEKILEEKLSGFEIPRKIIFEKQFLRTESGKIIRWKSTHKEK